MTDITTTTTPLRVVKVRLTEKTIRLVCPYRVTEKTIRLVSHYRVMPSEPTKLSPATEARARRAADSIGYVARKWRARVGTPENFGDFMIVDPSTNIPVAGFSYDMTAAEVIDWCKADD